MLTFPVISMRSIWTGAISFGLVNIPVKLYSAVEHKATQMHLLHKETLSPIRYKRWCDECEEEVAWNDIVKGVEVGKGRYVVLTDQELNAIKPEKSNRINVIEFIDSSKIDPILFDHHYFVGPEVAKDKPYFLFQEALARSGRIAVAQFVMRTKEYMCVIRPYRDGLVLTTLNYAYEIRDIMQIEELRSRATITSKEMELADQLIGKITAKNFDIKEFRDTFAEGLKQILDRKIAGEKITVVKQKKLKTSEKNLIEALKASL